MAGLPLVTGATGFAGSHLVEHLLGGLPAVAAWGNPSGRGVGRSDPRVQWTAVDLLDRRAVAEALDAVRPSAVYHCAGSAHVGDSFAEPERALRVNVLGTHHVLEGVREAGLTCRVLVIGSAMVYRHKTGAIDENDPIGPSSPYGVSKLAQEMLALRATHAPVVLARPFNHAGPRQSPSYVTSSFAQQIAGIEAGLREPGGALRPEDALREVGEEKLFARAFVHQSFVENVPELAHVPRPGVGRERQHARGRGAQRTDGADFREERSRPRRGR